MPRPPFVRAAAAGNGRVEDTAAHGPRARSIAPACLDSAPAPPHGTHRCNNDPAEVAAGPLRSPPCASTNAHDASLVDEVTRDHEITAGPSEAYSQTRKGHVWGRDFTATSGPTTVPRNGLELLARSHIPVRGQSIGDLFPMAFSSRAACTSAALVHEFSFPAPRVFPGEPVRKVSAAHIDGVACSKQPGWLTQHTSPARRSNSMAAS